MVHLMVLTMNASVSPSLCRCVCVDPLRDLYSHTMMMLTGSVNEDVNVTESQGLCSTAISSR